MLLATAGYDTFLDRLCREVMALGFFFCCFGGLGFVFLKEHHMHSSSPVTHLEALCTTTYSGLLIHFITAL